MCSWRPVWWVKNTKVLIIHWSSVWPSVYPLSSGNSSCRRISRKTYDNWNERQKFFSLSFGPRRRKPVLKVWMPAYLFLFLNLSLENYLQKINQFIIEKIWLLKCWYKGLIWNLWHLISYDIDCMFIWYFMTWIVCTSDILWHGLYVHLIFYDTHLFVKFWLL